MAKIVLGIGTSHSPTLQNPVENWNPERAEARDKPGLAKAGLGDWDAMVREKASWMPKEIEEERIVERYHACQKAIGDLSDVLHEVNPDVVVVVGDDHYEVFSPDHMPGLSLHWADSMVVLPLGMAAPDGTPEEREATFQKHTYPGDSELGEHLLKSLTGDGFDMSHTRTLERGQGLGHTFDFVCRRLMNGKPVAQVPILLNTYYPPNRPSAKRCYALGKSLRRAIEEWDTDRTVGIIGSGGLTHMVLNADMDHAVLAAIKERDEAGLTRYPESVFVDGTSEIKAWVVLAGAMEQDEREMQLIDYQACYRTPAGTGCGMGFAYWK